MTMPKADEVAVVNTETFKVDANIPVGRNPVGVAVIDSTRKGKVAFCFSRHMEWA